MGGSEAGGAPTGGVSSGGTQTEGGAPAGGGASTGGNASAAGGSTSPSGGSSAGGSTSPSGGSSAGGGTSPSGGSSAGGSSTGGASSGGSGPGGAGTEPLGFNIQPAVARSIYCESFGGDITLFDANWICTFDYEDLHGFVYLVATIQDCESPLGVPPYSTTLAQISINGTVEDLAGATYEWGTHHNDILSFSYGGNQYYYYHSSFGSGWRSCQNMDCLQVSVGATGRVTEDGCTPDRTIPVVCSSVDADGHYDDLTLDPFEWCAGDPNH